MISKQILKEIIISNRDYILNEIPNILPREEICLPEKLNKVVILYGVRRSGKSYILYDIFKKNQEKSLYIDFEDERLTGFEVSDFEHLKEAFFEINPQLKTAIFLFDEIQNIQGWEKFTRRVCERENIKVFVTGSSSRVMPKEIHTALRGRAWSVEVRPFSFREGLKAKNIDIGNKGIFFGRSKIKLKKYFSEYLKWGGFPEVVLAESNFEKRKIIKEYLEAMFFKDLVERFNITNTHLLSVLMENLFSAFSTKFSLNSFYKHYKQKFPFSKDTLFLYYKHLLDTMLIFEVRKFAESTYKRLRNPAKIYLADAGLSKKVTSMDSGRLMENVAFLALRKKAEDIFYFEEGKECDFITKDTRGEFAAYQVTQELNKEREIKGLISTCKRLSLSRGAILTEDQSEHRKIEGIDIRIIPLWQWLCEAG